MGKKDEKKASFVSTTQERRLFQCHLSKSGPDVFRRVLMSPLQIWVLNKGRLLHILTSTANIVAERNEELLSSSLTGVSKRGRLLFWSYSFRTTYQDNLYPLVTSNKFRGGSVFYALLLQVDGLRSCYHPSRTHHIVLASRQQEPWKTPRGEVWNKICEGDQGIVRWVTTFSLKVSQFWTGWICSM